MNEDSVYKMFKKILTFIDSTRTKKRKMKRKNRGKNIIKLLIEQAVCFGSKFVSKYNVVCLLVSRGVQNLVTSLKMQSSRISLMRQTIRNDILKKNLQPSS
jgi:hypothetical protein